MFKKKLYYKNKTKQTIQERMELTSVLGLENN